MYVSKLQAFLNSIDQKGDRLLFSLNHLSQHQSHSYKPADIPERHLGINPCRMSPQSLAEMHHTMHAQSGGPEGVSPIQIILPLDFLAFEKTKDLENNTRASLESGHLSGQCSNRHLIFPVISTVQSITYDRRMHVGTANSSVHVRPLERTTPTSVALPCCALLSMCTAVFFHHVGCSSSSHRELQIGMTSNILIKHRKQGPHAPPDLSTCLRQS
jgi:hypothetical protein